MLYAQVHLTLPAWLHQLDIHERRYPDAESQVALAIDLAARNVAEASGGPFGAAIFDGSGRLIGAGVNRVVPQTCSVAHAEMMAFMTAQQRLQLFRLNDPAGGAHGPITLATSAQPCCMCYGASFWAGLDRLLIGARSEDVMELTEFDEGPLPADWIGELERRGISVQRDILRENARAVLRQYAESGVRY
ncbi:nucleoside deaminase [Pseudomarimonas salicorniae]|uniref:Nucleoside deaminase n=1 Tax=Pseudomarimonas salicorniae TaxID=2933270 RepID=A0ABT0GFN6_9GAMM|nr:nucleoside deaminase [Lysobacter sp. CAU 1642]MCK7592857.1 nucleoside deaminase [Lysobacter sp. CAU 1642]